jgi:hypothetical protein
MKLREEIAALQLRNVATLTPNGFRYPDKRLRDYFLIIYLLSGVCAPWWCCR